jgi:hypothetical protein
VRQWLRIEFDPKNLHLFNSHTGSRR